MRHILFLDIDGVMAGRDEYGVFLEDRNCAFSSVAVDALDWLVKTLPALEIVISSSWRIGLALPELQEIFKTRGFTYPENIRDVTPRLHLDNGDSCPRGVEIDKWLRDNTSSEEQIEYCIVDDDSDMLYKQRFRFVQIPRKETLSAHTAVQILSILA